ncbi:MAG: DUF1998 domain-containing protein [Vicinamibacterales bacterium]
MAHKQIRIGQIIAPFGPGSIYTDRRGTPHVVCGLDHWFKRWDQTQGLVPCQDPGEFQRFEPRLAALLRVDRFCAPPDYRATRMGETPPPNAQLFTPALRFPRWYRHTRTGDMRRFNLNSQRIDPAPGGGRWMPVRFIAVCAAGHLCEFPWKEWIGCQCAGDGTLILTDRGGSELTSIRVECRSCPQGSSGRQGKSLSGTTVKPDESQGERSALQAAGIGCPGDRPWLGEGANETCNRPLVGALINQTNIYFPRTISAILLPDLQEQDDTVTQVRNEIEQDPGTCGIARTLWNMNNRVGAVALVAASLQVRGIVRSHEQVERALGSLLVHPGAVLAGGDQPADPESEMRMFRRAEFNVIRAEVNDAAGIPNLRVIPSHVPADLAPWLSKVNLVERLRETRVFYGFDRLEPNPQPLAGMPDTAMTQLFRTPPGQPQERWLPATEVFGEGIYIELSEESISAWQVEHEEWIKHRLDDAFIARLANVFQTLPPLGPATWDWASRYLLVHSVAHILINQFVFECGYSTASLRERLYVSEDANAPMAGFLIYTAAGDSEGTLGGLVRLGRPERLGSVVRRALSRASWCSADPVCSENLGGQGSRLANLAACHACTLLPETSCETINQGLDRAMIVGTPGDRVPGWMAVLLTQAFTLE